MFSAFVFRRRIQAEGLFEGRRDPLALPAPQRLAAPPRAEADRGGRRQPGEGEATLSGRCFRPVGKSRPIYKSTDLGSTVRPRDHGTANPLILKGGWGGG